MNDEGKLYDAIARSNNVNALLENGELNKAFEELKAELINKWMQSPTRDVAGRERLHLEINLIDKLRTHLRNVLDHGTMAQADLNARSKRAVA